LDDIFSMWRELSANLQGAINPCHEDVSINNHILTKRTNECTPW
jgi:hypothetical protein